MAKVLKSFGMIVRGPVKYPWDKWLDGRAWLLTQGVDFTVGRLAFKCAAHKYAQTHGMAIITKMDGSRSIVIQAVKAEVWTPPEGEYS